MCNITSTGIHQVRFIRTHLYSVFNPCSLYFCHSKLTTIGYNGSAMSAVCYNGANNRLIHEADQLISYIERGSTVLKCFPRKRPEWRTLLVRRETHQAIWFRTGVPQRQGYEGALDIRNVKEVRLGKASNYLERWPEETKRIENSKCFTIFYGTEFKLRSVSFSGIT